MLKLFRPVKFNITCTMVVAILDCRRPDVSPFWLSPFRLVADAGDVSCYVTVSIDYVTVW